MARRDFAEGQVRYLRNPKVMRSAPYPDRLKYVLEARDARLAKSTISRWPGYAPTPLYHLKGWAAEIGVDAVYYKDEGERFGLGSFKALGGAYAVLRVLERELSERTGKAVSAEAIEQGEVVRKAAELTVVTATDGNHGRSVAWGAQRFGCRCLVYMHAGVSEARADAVRAFGAEVVRTEGDYDRSVQQAATDAQANGWFVVSDTAYAGYTEVPRQVMAGYTVLAAETLDQLGASEPRTGELYGDSDGGAPDGGNPDGQLDVAPTGDRQPVDAESADPSGTDEPPLTHVFVQGGVGGLAAAMCAYLWSTMAEDRPRFVVVEPQRADCLFQSIKHGRPTVVKIMEETVMAGLSCGEVSQLAWPILLAGAEDFLALADDAVAPAMRLLADGAFGDPPIVAGESAVAGVCALLAAGREAQLKAALGLDSSSRVLLIGTEGATDAAIYASLVGRTAEQVRNGDASSAST